MKENLDTPDISKFDKVVSMLELIQALKGQLRTVRQTCANKLRDLTIDDLTHVRESISEIGFDSEMDEVLDTLFNRVYADS